MYVHQELEKQMQELKLISVSTFLEIYQKYFFFSNWHVSQMTFTDQVHYSIINPLLFSSSSSSVKTKDVSKQSIDARDHRVFQIPINISVMNTLKCGLKILQIFSYMIHILCFDKLHKSNYE